MNSVTMIHKIGSIGKIGLISAVFAVVIAIGIISIGTNEAYAGEYPGTVYFNLSDDGKPVMSDKTDEPMMLVPVSLQDVADVDLEAWGYEDYAYQEYNGGEPDPERPTVLKLFLYMLDNYKDNPRDSETMNLTGSVHSAYMTKFWGHDENLNYYVNGAYPLFEEGWGATCDGIALEDGDRVDVMMFSDWNFWTDTVAGFNFFADADEEPEDGAIVGSYEAKVGEALPVQVIRGYGSLMIGGATEYQAADDLTIHVSEPGGSIDADHSSDLKLDSGRIELTFEEPGEYYIWVDGGTGASGTPVQSAAAAKVTVKPGTHVHDMTEHAAVDATCTNPGASKYWSCSGCGKYFNDKEGTTEIAADSWIIPATGHDWDKGQVTRKATATKDGVKTFRCKHDGSHTRTEPIVQAPAVPAISADGNQARKSLRVGIRKVAGATGYVIQYREAGASKWISRTTKKTTYNITKLKLRGMYEVRVAAVRQSSGKTVQGRYSGILYRYIKNAAPLKVKAAKRSAKVTWSKDAKATGYRICYSTNKNMKGQKIITVKGASKKAYTIRNLKKGKTYYIAVRPYKTKKGHCHTGISVTKAVRIR